MSSNNSKSDKNKTEYCFSETDIALMGEAMALAKEAEMSGEVPVGAVVVRRGEIIGRGRNRRESGGGATAHAEIEAINEACRAIGGWRLSGCEIFVTLEPCPMCAGAIIGARIDRVVFAASDISEGAMGGLFDLTSYPLGCRPLICGGLMADQASDLIKSFFSKRREAIALSKPKRLLRDFYTRHADIVAPELLGKLLCRRDRENGEVKRARITETECYIGEGDTACHVHKGKTDRNRVMWEKGGTVYVYLCYGMHSLLNIVSGCAGEPEAVLIRCVEGAPGPGKLTKLFGIDKKFNGSDVVFSDEIWIEDDGMKVEYTALPRVGIDYAEPSDRDRPWRYTVTDNSKI